jgi:glycosyltransferase involved in cell wall biosynthesis
VFLFAERVAGRWTDRLVVINDEDEAAALAHRLVRRGALVRMPGIGVDTDHYARAALSSMAAEDAGAAVAIPVGAPYFVYVGEFSRNKRQTDAIAALARLRDQHARLVLLGDGPLRGELEAVVDRLGLADRVEFAGIVGDVRPIVAASTGLVLCSGREGLARSVMEALALEVPVVASNARGNRELVGDCGRIVGIGDIDGLAQAMDWLLDHPDERRVMGQRGRSRMVESYDLRVVTRLHEDLYASMLAERSATVARSAGPGPSTSPR